MWVLCLTLAVLGTLIYLIFTPSFRLGILCIIIWIIGFAFYFDEKVTAIRLELRK